MEKIIITGISGQDGLFLSKLLLKEHENISILGFTRNDDQSFFFNNLKKIHNKDHEKIQLIKVDYNNFHQITDLIKSFSPNYIYNLMGPSSVYDSIANPKNGEFIKNTFDSITNALIEDRNFCNFFQSSSSEMFDISNLPLSEDSIMRTRSPYAEAKLRNHLKAKEYYDIYDWKITSGIMFNHESEFRSTDYLIMKIIKSAIEISRGKNEKLTVGTTKFIRDWSFAGDIMRAAFLINTKGSQSSYVIGSGVGTSIEYILDYIFSNLGLSWEEHTIVDPSLLRKGDSKTIISDPRKLKKELNWEPSYEISNLLDRCMAAKIN